MGFRSSPSNEAGRVPLRVMSSPVSWRRSLPERRTGCCDAGEKPLCAVEASSSAAEARCRLMGLRGRAKEFCPGQSSCSRFKALEQLENRASHQFTADKEYSREGVNSVVFNAFIFMQASAPI